MSYRFSWGPDISGTGNLVGSLTAELAAGVIDNWNYGLFGAATVAANDYVSIEPFEIIKVDALDEPADRGQYYTNDVTHPSGALMYNLGPTPDIATYVLPESEVMDYPFEILSHSRRNALRADGGALVYDTKYLYDELALNLTETKYEQIDTFGSMVNRISRPKVVFDQDGTTIYHGYFIDTEWNPLRVAYKYYNLGLKFRGTALR